MSSGLKGIGPFAGIFCAPTSVTSKFPDHRSVFSSRAIQINHPAVTFNDVKKEGVSFSCPRVTKADLLEYIEDLKYKLRRDALVPFIVKPEVVDSFLLNTLLEKAGFRSSSK